MRFSWAEVQLSKDTSRSNNNGLSEVLLNAQSSMPSPGKNTAKGNMITSFNPALTTGVWLASCLGAQLLFFLSRYF